MAWRKGPTGKILKRYNSIVIADTCCCEPNCSDCPYGTAEEGYPASDPIVDTLYARIEAVEGCECLDGLCIPLLWQGINGHIDGSWQGTIALPGCTNLPEADRYLTLFLRCCQVDIEGEPAAYFWLGSDDCGAGSSPAIGNPCPDVSPPVNHSQPSEDGWSCRPYNLTYLNFPGLYCCGVMPATFNVYITETAC